MIILELFLNPPIMSWVILTRTVTKGIKSEHHARVKTSPPVSAVCFGIATTPISNKMDYTSENGYLWFPLLAPPMNSEPIGKVQQCETL